MSRHCPSCDQALSFENFLIASTNSNRQWACKRCGHILKKDMSAIFSTFVLFLVHAVLVVLVFGFFVRVRQPHDPELVLLGFTKGAAILLLAGISLAIIIAVTLVFYYLYHVSKFDHSEK